MNKNLLVALIIIAAFVVGSLYFYKQYPIFQSTSQSTPATPEEDIDSALNEVDETTVQTSGGDFDGLDLNATDLGL